MKKSSIFFAALICMMMNTVSVFANERVISAEQLPAAAKTFVKKNFPGLLISYAKIDNEFMKTRYEVRLNNGTKLKFDKDGNWEKVNCKHSAVPAHLVPSTIANQVKRSYNGTFITKIDKGRYGNYEVELSNKLDLRFNKNGQLTRVDD